MKNTKILKNIALASVLAMVATGATAQATDITGMVTQANGQLNAVASLAGMIAFLTGFVFGIMGFMKLKANAANPNDPSNKVSTAFVLIFVGAALIAVPAVMGIGVQSLFGGKGNTANLSTGGGGFVAVE
jgi:heme/copper-type cytochrome/quinol oxidase subunit 2